MRPVAAALLLLAGGAPSSLALALRTRTAPTGPRGPRGRTSDNPLAPVVVPSVGGASWSTAIRRSGTRLHSAPHSVIPPSDDWGNAAALAVAASLSQVLGRRTAIGRLLGAPVTAMALAFVLSSVAWIPPFGVGAGKAVMWRTLLPPGGSNAASFLQRTSLTLATPLLLVGTGLDPATLRRCGSLLLSFLIASAGTLAGSSAALSSSWISDGLRTALPDGDGIKIAAALLAKNIGGGLNYVAVCGCLGAGAESVAAGLCVDNIAALVYFPVTSVLASRHGDLEVADEQNDGEEEKVEEDKEETSPVESLSNAFALGAILTCLGRLAGTKVSSFVPGLRDLSLPATTLLSVAYATCYPADSFLSTFTLTEDGRRRPNDVARTAETLGTALLYLFFATAGAPGWRLAGAVRSSFGPVASFLCVLYGVHGLVLWGARRIVRRIGGGKGVWDEAVEPQRLLAASSAAIGENKQAKLTLLLPLLTLSGLLHFSTIPPSKTGGPATACALAKSFGWNSLLTPSLIVGNVGYAVATFLGLLFYSVYR